MTDQGDIELDQAYYGARSRMGDYDVLCTSSGLSRAHCDVVAAYSNIGGTAQEEQAPPPLFMFYAIASGLWAFSKTVFFPGLRGNEYLAHVIALDANALGILRGDVFALEELGLVGSTPPAVNAALPRLQIDASAVSQLAGRSIGSLAPKPVPSWVQELLKQLSRGIARVRVTDGQQGIDACRWANSLLPPEDRVALSFCTRLSQPRRLSFRLAAYLEADASLVRFLDGQVRGAHSDGDLAPWLEMTRTPCDPLWAISVFSEPDEAAALVSGIHSGRPDWNNALEKIVTDVRNRGFLAVDSFLAEAVARQSLGCAQHLLGGQSSPQPSFSHHPSALRSALEILPTLPADPLTRQLATLILVLGGGEAFSTDDLIGTHQSLWPDVGGLRDFVRTASQKSPDRCLEVLTGLLTWWRQRVGIKCLAAIGKTAELKPSVPAFPYGLLIGALEAAAPQEKSERQAWFLGVVRRVCLPPEQHTAAARLVLQEDLLPWLSDDERGALAPAMAAELPEALLSQLERPLLAQLGGFHEDLLEACDEGFRVGGQPWNIQTRPARWSVAARVAAAAADNDLQKHAAFAWLLWGMSRLLPGQTMAMAGGDDEEYTHALEVLLTRPPSGLADIAVRTLYRIQRFAPSLLPELSTERRRELRQHALVDADEHSPDPIFRLATRARVAWLDGFLQDKEY